MTVSDLRDAVTTPSIPRPRTAPEPAVRSEPAPRLPAARYPWSEPWGSFRGNASRTEFWDVTTASWHSSGPLPRPRSGY